MSQNVEIASNIQRKFFALNVRRDGPQPSIFVRSFSAITISRRSGSLFRFPLIKTARRFGKSLQHASLCLGQITQAKHFPYGWH